MQTARKSVSGETCGFGREGEELRVARIFHVKTVPCPRRGGLVWCLLYYWLLAYNVCRVVKRGVVGEGDGVDL